METLVLEISRPETTSAVTRGAGRLMAALGYAPLLEVTPAERPPRRHHGAGAARRDRHLRGEVGAGGLPHRPQVGRVPALLRRLLLRRRPGVPARDPARDARPDRRRRLRRRGAARGARHAAGRRAAQGPDDRLRPAGGAAGGGVVDRSPPPQGEGDHEVVEGTPPLQSLRRSTAGLSREARCNVPPPSASPPPPPAGEETTSSPAPPAVPAWRPSAACSSASSSLAGSAAAAGGGAAGGVSSAR